MRALNGMYVGARSRIGNVRRIPVVSARDSEPETPPAAQLVAIRAVHTVIWGFFAGCIVAIPIFACLDELRYAAALIAVTFVEVLVLALNGGSCPLTRAAARYTTDRRDNFDIYLPEWLARNNKRIFGTMYAAGAILTAYLWYSNQNT
jgi:hypothetical protein